VNDNVTVVVVLETTPVIIGAGAISDKGVTSLEADDGLEEPVLFVAVTVNV
jgi:hypothetical protein